MVEARRRTGGPHLFQLRVVHYLLEHFVATLDLQKIREELHCDHGVLVNVLIHEEQVAARLALVVNKTRDSA